MDLYYKDNIVAISTAPENGPVGIVRVSGPNAKEILQEIFIRGSHKVVDPTTQTFPIVCQPAGQRDPNNKRTDFIPRHFHYGRIRDKDETILDQALAVYMPQPHTFTGEDVVEFHCHGNLTLLKGVVRAILCLDTKYDIRGADPGEFSKRAFLNHKMDLTQAEAIHEIITANSEAALNLSLRNLDGYLKKNVDGVKEDLINSLALVEAGFEFPDDDIQTYDVRDVIRCLFEANIKLMRLRDAYSTSKLYDQGVSVAIVGPPNVGKSSLLNVILSEDRAIVTATPGTTRDVVHGEKILSGIRFIFRDTAGIRDTIDEIEAEGVRRSREWSEKSHITILVFEDGVNFSIDDQSRVNNKNTIRVLNKIDLLSGPRRIEKSREQGIDIFISAKKGLGIKELEEKLVETVNVQNYVHNNVHINQRQFLKIEKAIEILEKVKVLHEKLELEDEVLAEEIRAVIYLLDEITGAISSDDVLGEIFKKFCIGK